MQPLQCDSRLSDAKHNSITLATAAARKMAASTFLAAAAASVILLCFASESRESHCNGCIKVENGALAADFAHFGMDDFPLIFF